MGAATGTSHKSRGHRCVRPGPILSIHEMSSRKVSKTGVINYRPQTKFAKVMFLQVSVCPQGGRAWLLPGGRAWLLRGGACVVAPGGGVHGCSWGGGMRGCSGGDMRGCSRGGMHGCCQGGMHGCSWGGMHGFFDEIWSMSGRYASYWNAFLL